MPNPSTLNQSKTHEHDDIHLWLHDDVNLKECLRWNKVHHSLVNTDNNKRHGALWEGSLLDLTTGWKHGKLWYEYFEKMKDEHKQLENKESIIRIIDTPIISFRIRSIEREKALYNRSYCIGVTDMIVKYYVDIHYHRLWYHNYVNSDSMGFCNFYESKSDKKEEEGIDTFTMLLEIKPKLTSVSGIMAQLKAYKDCIVAGGFTHRDMIGMVIVTYDTNKKYDGLLNSENIAVFRISKEG